MTAGVTVIKAVHITEIRNAVNSLPSNVEAPMEIVVRSAAD